MSSYSYGGSGAYGRDVLVDLKSVDIVQLRSAEDNHKTLPHIKCDVAQRLSERSKNLLLATIEDGLLDSQAIITIRNSATREKSKMTVEEFLNTIGEGKMFHTEDTDAYPTPPPLRAAALRAKRREQLQHVGGYDLDEDDYEILPSPRISITSTSSSGYSLINLTEHDGILYEFEDGLEMKISRFVKEIQYFTPQFKLLARKNILLVALALLLIAFFIIAISVTITLLEKGDSSNSIFAPLPLSTPNTSTSFPPSTSTLLPLSTSTTSTSLSPSTSTPLPLSTSTTSSPLTPSTSTSSTPLPTSTSTAPTPLPLTTTLLPRSTSTPEEIITLTTAKEQDSTMGSTELSPSTSNSTQKVNQHRKCHVGSDGWPTLWIDVVLLIDNSAKQSIKEFGVMKNKIKTIWQDGQGNPIVSQETGKTRVGIIAFSSSTSIIARLDELHSNAELTNTIEEISHNTSTAVDGASALTAAATLLSPLASGSRSNAPNVIIIYTANWDGTNACQVAQTILQNTIIMVVAFNRPNQPRVNIPSCVYWPGEIYEPDANLDLSLLEGLSYVNCICPGSNLPNNNGGTEKEKTNRALDEWYQFWLPRADGKYYLRDKWAECVLPSFSALTHDQAQDSCHRNQANLPNEFSMEKHTFLINLALVGNFISQWNGLQYDPSTHQWYWDNFDRSTNQSTQTWVEPEDFTLWNSYQPEITDSKYCVKVAPATGGQIGSRWTTTTCNGLNGKDRLQSFCEIPACDAFKYCNID